MESNYSLADLASVTGSNGMGGSAWVLIILFALLFGGFNGGFGNSRGLGYENYATSNEVQRGFDNQNLQAQTRDILGTVSDGTAQTVSAINQAKYDNINVAKDIQMALSQQINQVAGMEQNLLAKEQECCCATLRAIDGVNYNNAMNTASINANTTAQTQKILDAIVGNRMADMQNQINALQLQNAMNGVVRYPNATTYTSGSNPFCGGCGCGNI